MRNKKWISHLGPLDMQLTIGNRISYFPSCIPMKIDIIGIITKGNKLDATIKKYLDKLLTHQNFIIRKLQAYCRVSLHVQ